MEVVIDPDVKAVAEFMQSKIEARKLVGVADSLRAIAPILWGQYGDSPVQGIELLNEPITCESQSVSIESALPEAHADDGFAEAKAAPALPQFQGDILHTDRYQSTA